MDVCVCVFFAYMMWKINYLYLRMYTWQKWRSKTDLTVLFYIDKSVSFDVCVCVCVCVCVYVCVCVCVCIFTFVYIHKCRYVWDVMRMYFHKF